MLAAAVVVGIAAAAVAVVLVVIRGVGVLVVAMVAAAVVAVIASALNFPSEDENTWRQRLAAEMEEVCGKMLQQGLHLTHVVPVTSSRELHGGWNEGAWLYFASG